MSRLLIKMFFQREKQTSNNTLNKELILIRMGIIYDILKQKYSNLGLHVIRSSH
jgi:hypothetical protein